jgi:hypothetical protein
MAKGRRSKNLAKSKSKLFYLFLFVAVAFGLYYLFSVYFRNREGQETADNQPENVPTIGSSNNIPQTANSGVGLSPGMSSNGPSVVSNGMTANGMTANGMTANGMQMTAGPSQLNGTQMS